MYDIKDRNIIIIMGKIIIYTYLYLVSNYEKLDIVKARDIKLS